MQHLGELSNKLKEQVDSQSKEMEQAVQSVFQDLSESLRKCAASELNTISKDMEERLQNLKKKQSKVSAHYWKQSIMVNLVSALLLVTISVCMTGFYGWRIKEKHQELTRINAQIATQKKKESKFTKWGINAYQNGNQKYLVFPKGIKLEIAKTNNGQPAVLLTR